MENYKYSQKKKSTKSSLCWGQAVRKSNRVSRYFHSTLMSLDAWDTIPDAQQDNASSDNSDSFNPFGSQSRRARRLYIAMRIKELAKWVECYVGGSPLQSTSVSPYRLM